MKTDLNGIEGKSNPRTNLQRNRQIIQQNQNIKKGYKAKTECPTRKNSFSFYCEQLQSMNIVLCNASGNNVLHDIAGFKGRKKCIALDEIINLVKENKIPRSNLVIASNTKNRYSATPLQRAIILKLTKKQHSVFTLKDNTVVFCKKLLKNGANPECLELPSKFAKNYNLKLYHRFLNDLARSLKSSKSTPENLKDCVVEKISQITGQYEKNIGQTRTKCITTSAKNIAKKGIKGTGKTIKATWQTVSSTRSTRHLIISTAGVVLSAMMVFAFFQGEVTLMTALSVIGITAICCIALNLGLEKHFKKTCDKISTKISREEKNIRNSIKKKKYTSTNEIHDFSEFGLFQRGSSYKLSDEDTLPQTTIDIIEVVEVTTKNNPNSSMTVALFFLFIEFTPYFVVS